MIESPQFKRKASLLLLTGPLAGQDQTAYIDGSEKGLDLSEAQFRFSTQQQDVESPNNCSIRVYNLSSDLVRQIRGEFSRVILQAGYADQFGVIFDGLIKQFRIGKENATDSYLDILAADGDLGYNFGFMNQSIGAGSSSTERVEKIVKEMEPLGWKPGYIAPYTGGILPRGKVLFGMPRALLRAEAASRGATWNVENGQVNVVPLTGYQPGEAVVISSLTGMVGIPESTTEGVRVRHLLNPRFKIGGLVQIDNKTINKTVQQNPNAAPIAYNQYTGIQMLATTTDDGFYRLFVVEHSGDTRGQEWYSELTCLALDPTTKQVKPYG